MYTPRTYLVLGCLPSPFRRDGRVAEGAPLLREYGGKTPSRVRIPLSPPINSCALCLHYIVTLNGSVFLYCIVINDLLYSKQTIGG